MIMVSTSYSPSLFLLSSSSTGHLRLSPPPLSSVRFRALYESGRVSATCLSRPKMASHSHRTSSSFYEVLRIPVSATGTEIKAAYRRLARIFHPDVITDVDRRDSCGGNNEFIKIHDAYSTLSDPVKRADYDRRLIVPGCCNRESCDSPVRSSYSGYTPRRNWATDQCW